MFLTPSKTDGEFPASKVHLQPTTWLTGKFPIRRICPDITGQFGCGHREKFSPSVGVGGGGSIGNWVWPKCEIHPTVRGVGGGVEGERGFRQIANSSYSRHQIPSSSSGRASSDTLNCLFPSNTFLPKTSFAEFSVSTQGHIVFSKSPSLQKFVWGTDILRNRSIGCPCNHCW